MSSETSGGKRVTAFLLAALFLVSTVGATAYVIWQLNQDDTELGLAEQQQEEAPTPKLKGTALAGFAPQTEPYSQLKVEDISVGTGAEVKLGDSVTVVYTGALAKDGKIFESSLDSGAPATFTLQAGGLIEGWVQGLPGMKEGGKRRLYIPASLAYKDQDKGDIPPNSDLVFEVEVQAVTAPDATQTEAGGTQ
jgi:FKBP-type peptidyl-prolyl cis-trans isomerase